MKLTELLKTIEYMCSEPIDDIDIASVAYDSRKVQPGGLFVALKGAASDGHKFIESAVKNGASAVLVCEDVTASVPVVKTKDTREALALLAIEFFDHPADKLTTVGITGTKGKTTTAIMLKSILEAAGCKTGVIGTIGVLIGDELIKTDNTTPENFEVQRFMALMVEKGCKYCVMEVSSIGLRDKRVFGFTFDVGAFTNFSEDHIGGVEHKDMEEYLNCKAMLFRMCRTGVINIDDANYQGMIKNHTCDILTYGFNKDADIYGENNRLYSEPGFIGSMLDVYGKVEDELKISTPGKFNAYNALAALSVCHVLGIDEEAVRKGLSTVRVKGRVEPVPVLGNFTLLIDYAHNAVSMENILSTLREYNPHRLIVLFGAGGNRPKVRRFEMGEVAGNMADLSVITADNSRFEDVMDIIADIKVGMAKTSGKYIEIPDRRQAIRWCIENAEDGDIVVLAGKGHEDYQEIKGVKYPFDERVVIKEILADIAAGK